VALNLLDTGHNMLNTLCQMTFILKFRRQVVIITEAACTVLWRSDYEWT